LSTTVYRRANRKFKKNPGNPNKNLGKPYKKLAKSKQKVGENQARKQLISKIQI
jgi:hypothetical protein